MYYDLPTLKRRCNIVNVGKTAPKNIALDIIHRIKLNIKKNQHIKFSAHYVVSLTKIVNKY